MPEIISLHEQALRFIAWRDAHMAEQDFNMRTPNEIPDFLRRPLSPVPSPKDDEGNIRNAAVEVATVATPSAGPQTESNTPAAVPTNLPDPQPGQPGYIAFTHGTLTEADKRAMAEIENAHKEVATATKSEASKKSRAKKQEEKEARAKAIEVNRRDFHQTFKWGFE